MQAWWDALDILGKIFALIAIPSTLILVVQAVMMLIGIGSDHGEGAEVTEIDDSSVDIAEDVTVDTPDDLADVSVEDASTDTDSIAEPGLRILSFRTIIAFLAVFGWVGLEMLKLGVDSILAIVIAIAAGVAIMVIIAVLIRELFKLQSNGNTDLKNAIGMSGTAYIPIPAGRKGKGKVTVTFQNATHELDAVTDDEGDIPSYSEVLIIGISGRDTLIVKRK